jgi:tetratricopeptide (TPR) repeat protein
MDYQSELQRTDKDVAELRKSLATTPVDIEKSTKLAYRLYHRASLTGSFADMDAVGVAVDDALRRFGPQEDLCLLCANLNFKLHRLEGVKRALQMSPTLQGRPEGKTLQADLDFQEGRYREARKGFEQVIEENRTWDALARLAYFKFKMGEIAEAEQLYLDSEDELTAKEMRSYSWVELQRGVMAMSRGRYEDAAAHYATAGKAYPGYWMIDEHTAELLGAQDRLDEAAALYETVVDRVPRAEFQQALGEVYSAMDKPKEAEKWYGKAEVAYLQSTERAEVHYYHHLADFYADVRQDGPRAVKWALKDLELRRNFATQAALAWAFYRNGQFIEALEMVNQSLASGVQDARIFHQAGIIHQKAGQSRRGEELIADALKINPRHDCFHVHR